MCRKVSEPSGSGSRRHWIWYVPNGGMPCSPDASHVYDTIPFASTVHTRCWPFEYTMRRPLPLFNGNGGPTTAGTLSTQ